MRSEVVFVKQLLLVIILILLQELFDPLLITVTTYVLSEVSICLMLIFLIGCQFFSNMYPRQDWILRDIIVIPACDLVEPLQILIIRHELVDPMHRFH